MTTEKILKKLELNDELYQATRRLWRVGAGNIIEGFSETATRAAIAEDIAYCLRDPRAGEWETEIAKLVEAGDVGKIKKLLDEAIGQSGQCPECGCFGRIRKKKKGGWHCDGCKKNIE